MDEGRAKIRVIKTLLQGSEERLPEGDEFNDGTGKVGGSFGYSGGKVKQAILCRLETMGMSINHVPASDWSSMG